LETSKAESVPTHQLDGAGPEPTAREIMVPARATVGPATPVGEAHSLLREHGVKHLPVLRDGLLIGMVSQHDLMRSDSDSRPIGEVMRSPMFVLSPETPISRVARMFRERRVPVLPVLERRSLIGIVRAVDVLETAWDHAKA
jgi:acetoin utilization protein AcuB